MNEQVEVMSIKHNPVVVLVVLHMRYGETMQSDTPSTNISQHFRKWRMSRIKANPHRQAAIRVIAMWQVDCFFIYCLTFMIYEDSV